MCYPNKVVVIIIILGILGTGSDNTNNEDKNSAASIGVVKGCPNRNNPYHKCVEYCHTRWGSSDPTQAPHIKVISSFNCMTSNSWGVGDFVVHVA